MILKPFEKWINAMITERLILFHQALRERGQIPSAQEKEPTETQPLHGGL